MCVDVDNYLPVQAHKCALRKKQIPPPASERTWLAKLDVAGVSTSIAASNGGKDDDPLKKGKKGGGLP